jgi:sugar (pentulose or hexulose) kinase
MSFFLGIDLGTSYFKAGIFDESGRLHGLGRHPVERNGTVGELNIAVFWETIRLCIKEAVKNARITFGDIQALSYSSQANSFVLLDNSDTPLTPIIVWTDTRAAETPVALRELTEKCDFVAKTGLGIKPGLQSMIAKIDWFQKKHPRIWNKTGSILSVSDYFTFGLTGQKCSDLSTSSMTALLDTTEGKWWKHATELFGIKEESLPVLQRSGLPVGNIVRKGAEITGLSPHTLLVSGGLDHHMAAVGAGLTRVDRISESTGTVLACVDYKGEYSPAKGVNVAPGLDRDHFFRMAFHTNGAGALEWYQTRYASGIGMPALLESAEGIEAGCEGLVAKPSAHRYPDLSGFCGVKKNHTHAHFVRAIMESTSASLLQLIDNLAGTDTAQAIAPSGGGARSRLWLQIKANMLNRTFVLPESGELACKGAAMLCARFGNGENQIASRETTIYPDPAEVEKYKNWYHTIKDKII